MTTRWGETLIVPEPLEDNSSAGLLPANLYFKQNFFLSQLQIDGEGGNCKLGVTETKRSFIASCTFQLRSVDFPSSVAIPEISKFRFVDGAGVSLISHMGNIWPKHF